MGQAPGSRQILICQPRSSARSGSVVPHETLKGEEENIEQTYPYNHVDNPRENHGASGSSDNSGSTSSRPRRQTKQPRLLSDYVHRVWT